MFMTTKNHYREMDKLKDYYESTLNRVVTFHQNREGSIWSIISKWKDKFSNVSATKSMYDIEKILNQPKKEDTNGKQGTN